MFDVPFLLGQAKNKIENHVSMQFVLHLSFPSIYACVTGVPHLF